MKSLASILLALLFAVPALAQQKEKPSDEKVVQLSDPVEETDKYRVFGSEFAHSEKPMDLNMLVGSADSYSGQQVVTEGTITQVCQKKGCFFMLKCGEAMARVTFKDYSFFVPTNVMGSSVRLQGIFQINELTEDEADHLAEDLGIDKNFDEGAAQRKTVPQREYHIVASAVKIYDDE